MILNCVRTHILLWVEVRQLSGIKLLLLYALIELSHCWKLPRLGPYVMKNSWWLKAELETLKVLYFMPFVLISYLINAINHRLVPLHTAVIIITELFWSTIFIVHVLLLLKEFWLLRLWEELWLPSLLSRWGIKAMHWKIVTIVVWLRSDRRHRHLIVASTYELRKSSFRILIAHHPERALRGEVRSPTSHLGYT
jgi:hypothetical protein